MIFEAAEAIMQGRCNRKVMLERRRSCEWKTGKNVSKIEKDAARVQGRCWLVCLSEARIPKLRLQGLEYRGRDLSGACGGLKVDLTARMKLERRPRRFMMSVWNRLLRLRTVDQFRGVRSG